MDISVVVPLYNEEESLPELYAWIERVMHEHHFTYEVIFVNDGSTDHSWQVIEELSRKSKEVKGIKKFFEEFKAFAMRGNVIDMAVGVVIGGAFGKITTSLVNDIIMPLISMLTGGVDFSAWKWVLKEAVMEGKEVIDPEIAVNYGNLIAVILDFIIIAFAVFCMVKAVNRLHRKKEAAPPPPPKPTREEQLLTEIRDLLKEKA